MAKRGKPTGLLDAGKLFQQLAHPRSYSLYPDNNANPTKFINDAHQDDKDVAYSVKFILQPSRKSSKGIGSTSASAPFVPIPPTNAGGGNLPLISGSPVVDQTLSATPGSWTGTPTPSYEYQWKRGGVAISGATAPTYLLVSADLAATITVTVTATNSGGSANATSSGVGPVTGTAPTGGAPTYYFLGF